MQPAEAKADPAEWAEGQLQPSSRDAESHGSAPSAEVSGADADTADSEATGTGPGAGPTAGAGLTAGAGEARQEDGLHNMQVEAAHELESGMLNKGE